MPASVLLLFVVQGEARSVFDTVVLDPGHGGWDRGGLRNVKLPEKTMNLETALIVRDLLEENGLKVIMTRETDVFIPLSARVAIANRHDNAIFISIHYNADYGSAGHGIETYCSRYTAVARPLRHMIHEQLVSRTGARNRGERTAGYYVLRHADIPAVLVEGGFLSNPRESKKIGDPDYRRLLAECIADGVLDYRDSLSGLSLPRKKTPSKSEKPANEQKEEQKASMTDEGHGQNAPGKKEKNEDHGQNTAEETKKKKIWAADEKDQPKDQEDGQGRQVKEGVEKKKSQPAQKPRFREGDLPKPPKATNQVERMGKGDSTGESRVSQKEKPVESKKPASEQKDRVTNQEHGKSEDIKKGAEKDKNLPVEQPASETNNFLRLSPVTNQVEQAPGAESESGFALPQKEKPADEQKSGPKDQELSPGTGSELKKDAEKDKSPPVNKQTGSDGNGSPKLVPTTNQVEQTAGVGGEKAASSGGR
jgi:N-acetylmuramoyl-L-alanine amidase